MYEQFAGNWYNPDDPGKGLIVTVSDDQRYVSFSWFEVDQPEGLDRIFITNPLPLTSGDYSEVAAIDAAEREVMLDVSLVQSGGRPGAVRVTLPEGDTRALTRNLFDRVREEERAADQSRATRLPSNPEALADGDTVSLADLAGVDSFPGPRRRAELTAEAGATVAIAIDTNDFRRRTRGKFSIAENENFVPPLRAALSFRALDFDHPQGQAAFADQSMNLPWQKRGGGEAFRADLPINDRVYLNIEFGPADRNKPISQYGFVFIQI